MLTEQKGKNFFIGDIGRFSLSDTLDCGQAFRWVQNPDGSWQAVVENRLLKVAEAEYGFIIYDCTSQEFFDVWSAYFDIERDYTAICNEISSDPILKAAVVSACYGKRPGKRYVLSLFLKTTIFLELKELLIDFAVLSVKK